MKKHNNLICALFGVKWVLGQSIKDVLREWHIRDLDKKKEKYERLLLCVYFGWYGNKVTTT